MNLQNLDKVVALHRDLMTAEFYLKTFDGVLKQLDTSVNETFSIECCGMQFDVKKDKIQELFFIERAGYAEQHKNIVKQIEAL